jgi:hypothetical protein
LLFFQFVVPAYACATAIPGNAAMPSAGAMQPDQPCEHAGQPVSKLCEQHCLQSSQSVDTQPHSAPALPVLAPICIVSQSDFQLPSQRDRRQARLATLVDPPPLVRFGVLRI